MITPDFKKEMADSWFSYLQTQICKEFEYLEKNKVKFSKREWSKNKKNEGGGTSFLLSNGKIFDKVGVNKSTVSGIFSEKGIEGNFINGKMEGLWKFNTKIMKENEEFLKECFSFTHSIIYEGFYLPGHDDKKNYFDC